MASNFNVYYAASIDGIKTKDGTEGTSSGGYEFANLPTETTYYFVTAVNKNGEGAYSEPLKVLGQLPAPNNVTLTELSGYIQFTWNAVPEAVSYKVYRSNNVLGSDITSRNQWSRATVKDTSYSMLSTNLGTTTRWYFITSVNADGIESVLSAPVAYP